MADLPVNPLFPQFDDRYHSPGLARLVWILGAIILAVATLWLILAVGLSTSNRQNTTGPTPTPLRIFGDYTPQPTLANQEANTDTWPEFSSLFKVDAKTLQANLQAEAQKYPDNTIGISVRAITDQEHIAYGENTIFTAASTTKLITAAAVLKQVDQAKIKLTDSLGPSTVEDQLRLMINQSNNDSWDRLNNLVGLQSLQDYAYGLGLHDFTVQGNTISPSNLAAFLQMLYRYELLSDDMTAKLLSWMQDTNEENLLAKVFATDTLYHKYGWLNQYLHDVGIVVHNKQPFIIVIMTKGVGTYNQDATVIQNLATLVKQALK